MGTKVVPGLTIVLRCHLMTFPPFFSMHLPSLILLVPLNRPSALRADLLAANKILVHPMTNQHGNAKLHLYVEGQSYKRDTCDGLEKKGLIK